MSDTLNVHAFCQCHASGLILLAAKKFGVWCFLALSMNRMSPIQVPDCQCWTLWSNLLINARKSGSETLALYPIEHLDLCFICTCKGGGQTDSLKTCVHGWQSRDTMSMCYTRVWVTLWCVGDNTGDTMYACGGWHSRIHGWVIALDRLT